MPSKTYQQRYVAMLTDIGYVQVPSRSRDKLCFQLPNYLTHVYFLGKGGSIRLSKTGNVSDSFDV